MQKEISNFEWHFESQVILGNVIEEKSEHYCFVTLPEAFYYFLNLDPHVFDLNSSNRNHSNNVFYRRGALISLQDNSPLCTFFLKGAEFNQLPRFCLQIQAPLILFENNGVFLHYLETDPDNREYYLLYVKLSSGGNFYRINGVSQLLEDLHSKIKKRLSDRSFT